MDKATWKKFQPAMESFRVYLLQKHPDDDRIPEYLKELNDIVTNKQVDTSAKEAKREEKKIKLKSRILDSLCEDDGTDYDTSQLSDGNEQECIESLIVLQKVAEKGKRQMLKIGAQQGYLISKLAQNRRLQRAEICIFLAKHQVVFSLSHCYSLMDLWRMTQKFPKLLKCSICQRDITRNLKLVNEICSELNW